MTVRKLVSLTFLLLLSSPLAFAQGVATGDLNVTVRDPKGSLVTNATVSTRDVAEAFERSTAVNRDGVAGCVVHEHSYRTMTATISSG